MKVDEIRSLSADELTEKLASLKEELFGLRFQHATGQLDNPECGSVEVAPAERAEKMKKAG